MATSGVRDQPELQNPCLKHKKNLMRETEQGNMKITNVKLRALVAVIVSSRAFQEVQNSMPAATMQGNFDEHQLADQK